VVALDAQQRAHAGEQLGLIERLGDEVVRPRLDGGELLLLAARRDHHHGQELRRGVGAQRAADRVAVHLGHDDVEQHEVDRLRRHALERLLPRAGRDDRVAARHEHRLEQADVLRQVVDDEDRAGLAHVAASVPARTSRRATSRGKVRTSSGFSR
jgi:hypothetical protein